MFESVKNTALKFGKNLSDAQVNSIINRHKQLVKEAQNLLKEKRRQIDLCWQIREEERENENY